MKSRFLDEKVLHVAFEAMLLVKGAFAVMEIVAGVASHYVTHDLVLKLVERLTREEILEDPHDLIANYLLHSAQHLSVGTRNFATVYLVSHGVVKLWLIAGLLRARLWYYPLAMSIFGLFIAYQLYRFSHTHSFWLIVLTAVDVVVIALTWHEYRYLRSRRGVLRS
jgi:uncharacterized membrane protein